MGGQPGGDPAVGAARRGPGRGGGQANRAVRAGQAGTRPLGEGRANLATITISYVDFDGR